MKPIKVILLIFVILGTCVSAVFSSFIFSTLDQLGGIKVLETYKPPTPSQILDINNEIIAEFYRERRKIIDFTDISPNLIKATLSIEDKRFFSHYGIDFIRILKAFWVNFSTLQKKQGGSTLTIQLSKLIFLHHKKTIIRKIIELWYAIQIEKQYTKEEILKFYFNQINYGHGSYGVEAASEFFFNKSTSEINTAEAALLAAIPKSPVYYSPIRYPDRSSERHQIVLKAMVQNEFINQQTASESYQNFWSYFNSRPRNQQSSFADLAKNKAPYFTEYIRSKLEKDFPKKELYDEGIKIYTTLNLHHQKTAQKFLWKKLKEQNEYQEKINNHLPKEVNTKLLANLATYAKVFNFPHLDFQERLNFKITIDQTKKIQGTLKNIGTLIGNPYLKKIGYYHFNPENINFTFNEKVQGALISVNPQNGYITSMVGGSPFNYHNQFNRAINLHRQVGSILKPFIYALAIDNNLMRSSSLLKDAPTQFGNYIPKNYSSKFLGEITVREALRKSVNVLAVEVLDRIGISYARNQLAQIFGTYSETAINRQFPKDLTLALGTGSFSLLSVANAFALLANEGTQVIPRTIRYVTDRNGEILKNYEDTYIKLPKKSLIDQGTAFIIRDLTHEVFTPGGTAYKPNLLNGFTHLQNSFGKTGTTSNWKDAWFAGANHYLSAVVWIGYDDNRSLGRHRSGGRIAAPVWIQFQKEALNGKQQVGFQIPKNIIQKKVCLLCDGIASPNCPKKQVKNEYYKIDNYPQELCYNFAKKKEKQNQFKKFVEKIKENL